ncbi:MAG: TldD/PmbA family protein, partial [Gemmatimonadaceae bacterium]
MRSSLITPAQYMTSNRREFLKSSTAAAIAAAGSRLLLPAALVLPPSNGLLPNARGDAFVEDLALEALNAARDAGASYADVRIGRYRRQSIATRERQVTGVNDSESYGIGVRALVQGSWGFAATNNLSKDGAQLTAREAARLARAARTTQKRPVELAPVAAAKGTWRTPVMRDPVDVPIEEKVALLLAANEAALKMPKVRFVNSGMQLLREEKTLATTDGTMVTQTFVRVGPQFTATAIADGDFQSYTEEIAPRGQGWEYIESLDMPHNAEKWASLAAEKLSAKSVEVGRYDLILDPTNLWLTIHESIGHPTELDRAMGYEANYAGTSFIAPPDKMIGKLKYGPDFMNIQGDRTQEGSLARVAWDDEGVAADKWLIVDKGMFKDYQTTREQAAWIANLTGV